jgi:hypothetical protein
VALGSGVCMLAAPTRWLTPSMLMTSDAERAASGIGSATSAVGLTTRIGQVTVPCVGRHP